METMQNDKPSLGRKPKFGPKLKNTSWENVAGWYSQLLESEGTYQKELILPNLLRLMDIRSSDVVLDLACGQGFFAREFYKKAKQVIGVDASSSLVAIARKTSPKALAFHIARADEQSFIKDGAVDKVAIVLALQNMENTAAVTQECARVIKKGGDLFIVLNHPAFRVPKESSWGWDEKEKVQYRRVDRYLSELKVSIAMHPGKTSTSYTTSFHRPLQSYFKALGKAGFGVVAMEEWNSHKKSELGPRAAAEDIARKEIPLFLCLVGKKM
jgi:ubiquinone/menaquinone biosynthesis C-methylase UbiE